MAHDVFISYSSKDKTIADSICASLESRRIRCWIAPRDIVPGVPYGEALIEALSASRLLVLVFSSHANVSTQVAREVERACSKGLVIVPFRLEDVPMSKEMEYFLSSPHWLDALTPPLEQHLAYLADTVSLLLERMARGPAAPGAADAAATPGTQESPLLVERSIRSRVSAEQPRVTPAAATPASQTADSDWFHLGEGPLVIWRMGGIIGFNSNLFDDLGLATLSDGLKDQLLAGLSRTVAESLLARYVDSCPVHTRRKIETLLRKGEHEAALVTASRKDHALSVLAYLEVDWAVADFQDSIQGRDELSEALIDQCIAESAARGRLPEKRDERDELWRDAVEEKFGSRRRLE